MKTFGFFRETQGDPSLASVFDAVAGSAGNAGAAGYLDGGAVVLSSPESVFDPFAPDVVMGQALVLTDGEWVWPAEAAYLVRAYGLEVPAELAARMSAFGNDCPDVAADVLAAITSELVASGPLTMRPQTFPDDLFDDLLNEGDS
jgi:hypothetical protein